MLDLIKDLAVQNESKIVLLVADGLGGLPVRPGGPTELEAAATPNLDALVAENVCGLSVPVAPGITPGSGPGHLGLFGYDPLRFRIGRGVLEALGIDFDLGPDDVAAFIRSVLTDNSREHFVALYLDAAHCVVSYSLIAIGTADRCVVQPREIFQRAILSGAVAIIVAHNHPSGDPTPSAEDVYVTRQLVEAGKLLSIDVLDHLVIGHSGGWLSLKERGLGF